MDPKLMRMLARTPVMAPADTGDGGGGDGIDDVGDDVETGEDDDATDDDDDGDDGEDDADDDDADDAEEDDTEEDGDEDEDDADDDDEKDEELGKRAQARIGKLVAKRNAAEARVKELEGELEAARKLSGDDGKAIIRAAEASGILPGLMSKEEAEAFQTLEEYPGVIESYQDWLDEHGAEDELSMGDKALTYGQVKKRVRQLEARLRDVRDEYGERRKALKKRVREIFEAGVAALKAGKSAKPKAGDEAAKGKRKVKKTLEAPEAKNRRRAHAGRNPDDMDVEDENDLEAFIMADMRRKRK